MRAVVLLVMVSGVGCVADFGGLLDPGCAEDTDCDPPPAGTTCIDSRCDNGGCILEVRACDDGNACTSDACDVDTDECINDVLPDGTECAANALCAAGACECVDGFDDCDDEPGCEAHLASDPKHCHECDFECPPGQSCINAACGTCADDEDCDDSRSCTANLCGGNGACSNPVLDDACLIAGQCRTAGERSPDTRCQSCQPAVSQSTWSDAPDGTGCDDGNPCAVCREGACREDDGGDTDCCRAPHCRDALGSCRLPGALECVGADGQCCVATLCSCVG
jgi:hypothetical protein